MLIQKNLKISKTAVITTYHSSSSVFMVNNTPSGPKKHHKSIEPESHQMSKMFSFFFFFRRTSSNLHDSFTMVLHKTAAFSTEQCTSPSHFSMFEVSRGGSNCSLKNYGFLCDVIFSSRYTCAQIT